MANVVSGRFPGEMQLLKAKYAVMVLLGIAGTVYHLWFSRTYGLEMRHHMIVHLGVMMVLMPLISFDTSVSRSDSWIKILDNLLVIPAEIVASTTVTYYLFTNYTRLTRESLGIYTDADFIVGLVLIVLIIDLSRRAFGVLLPIVGLVGIVYALYGHYFPGILSHRGVAFRRLITSQTVEFSGIYDTLLQVAATYVVIFILLAGFLEAYGAMNYFIKLGARMGSYIRSGITQIAVVTSIGMGSVNGSAAANAATTGAFTIPLMKNQGINEDTAAAIESVASSGGQVMPPVMGAAAFIMAEITGVGYLNIISIGLIPALLFYGTVIIAVHFITLKENAGLEQMTLKEEAVEVADSDTTQVDVAGVDAVALGTSTRPSKIDYEQLESAEEQSVFRTFLNGLYLWIPVALLVYILVVLRYNPLTAGFWATAAVPPAALGQMLLLRDDYRQVGRDFVENTIEGCRLGMINAAPITLAVAVIAIFVGVLSLTGFTQLLSQSLVNLSGGVLVLLLFFAMVAAILFGLGMPTVAAYIVAVLLIAPALQNLGIRLETAHFFVFYFAVLSAITPPVAIACIITAEIAKGNFWRVCAKALVIGAPLFILPYVFIVNSSLLYWTFPGTILVAPVVLVGFICISVALINYLNGPLTVPVRVGLSVVGLGVLFAPVVSVGATVIQVVFAAIGVLALYLLSRTAPDDGSVFGVSELLK